MIQIKIEQSKSENGIGFICKVFESGNLKMSIDTVRKNENFDLYDAAEHLEKISKLLKRQYFKDEKSEISNSKIILPNESK